MQEKLIDKLTEECTENVEEAKLAKIRQWNCIQLKMKIYINAVNVLFSIIFSINIGIGTYFVYYKYMNCNKESVSKYNYVYQTTHY